METVEVLLRLETIQQASSADVSLLRLYLCRAYSLSGLWRSGTYEPRIPADIRAAGGVSRMSDPKMIRGIQEAVSIPVMAKCRIGHFVEAQILEAIEIDYIDESEVLSPADDVYHIDKTQFKVPFVCGARDLGEALRRCWTGCISG